MSHSAAPFDESADAPFSCVHARQNHGETRIAQTVQQPALLNAVIESSRLVCSSLDLNEVLNLILQAAHDLSDAQSVTVMLLDEAGEWLTIGAAIGTPNTIRHNLRLRVGEGLAGWVAQTGQPLHLNNPTDDPRYRELPSSHISNILSLPLRVRDRIVGVLNLSQYFNRGLFSDMVVQTMEIFASHAAIAIDNAATAASLRRAAARERLLNQINQSVRDMNDLDAVIERAMEGLGLTLDVTWCAIYRGLDTTQTFTFHKTHQWVASHCCTDVPLEIDVSGWTTGSSPGLITRMLAEGFLMMAPLYQRDRCMSWLRVYAHERMQRWRDDELDLVQAVADHLSIAISQGELAVQERRSRELSESLSQLAAACNAMISQKEVLSFILEQLARFISYDSAGVWVHHEENYIIMVAGQGFISEALNTILYTGPGTLNWRVARLKQAYVSADVQQEAGWQNVPDSDLIHSWIGVPLLVNQKQIGMLTIDKRQRDSFHEADAYIAQAFADHVAVAIQNAQLYQQTQQRANQLQALHRLSIHLSAMREVQALIESLARLLHETFGYYQINVGLVRGEALILQAACGKVNDAAEYGNYQNYPPERGLIGWAFRYNQTVLVNDITKDPRYVVHSALQETCAELVVPIRNAQRLIGIIDVQSNHTGAFSQDDVYVVEALAGQTAVALENLVRYDELRRTQDELLRSERLRALGELSSGVAHDFNNLLAGILGHAQLLLLDYTDPVMLDSLSVIERAALDGAATVRRLQDFAQTHHSPPEDVVDINHVLEESLAITRPRWRDATQSCGVHIEIIRELAPVHTIIGDAPVLRELLTNLILNAIDAMPYGGNLRVCTYERTTSPASIASTHQSPSEVVIEVGDTGVGMSPSIQKRIFDPFFTTKGARGTGMGLAVAHGIVQRHNGTITVQSMPDQGSTFIITLPTSQAFQSTSGQNRLHKQNQKDVEALSGNILVIEDEASVRHVLVEFLLRWGCQVEAVESGAEAMSRFMPGRFDLVCTDLGMPGMSGWEVLDQVRQVDPTVATVLVTGWGDQLNPEEARIYGADYIVVKPFDAAQLYQAMHGSLLMRRLRMTNVTYEQPSN